MELIVLDLLQQEAEKGDRRIANWTEVSAKLNTKVDDLRVKVNSLFTKKPPGGW